MFSKHPPLSWSFFCSERDFLVAQLSFLRSFRFAKKLFTVWFRLWQVAYSLCFFNSRWCLQILQLPCFIERLVLHWLPQVWFPPNLLSFKHDRASLNYFFVWFTRSLLLFCSHFPFFGRRHSPLTLTCQGAKRKGCSDCACLWFNDVYNVSWTWNKPGDGTSNEHNDSITVCHEYLIFQ